MRFTLLGVTVAPVTLARQNSSSRPRGTSLATIMDCGGCHTGGVLAGQPDPKLHLAGRGQAEFAAADVWSL